jgi:UDP-glucose:(heptosyl)LPS alpha-1,3-glucosyltransferase
VKIAYVIINANRHEGTARAVWEVAERVAEEHEVHLWARTADLRERSKVIWRRIPGPSRPEVVDFVSFRWLLDRQILRYGYDIIHSAGPNTDVANVYTIQTVHPCKMAQLNPMRVNATASRLRRFCWERYDKAVTAAEKVAYTSHGPLGRRFFLPVSEGTRQELIEQYPRVKLDAAGSNIEVVPNGADLQTFSPNNRALYRNDVRERLGLSPDDFVLVFSGGDWRRKGLDLLFEAIRLIDDSRVKLLVIGRDRSDHDLKGLPAQLGIDSRVVFAGFRSDIEKYYAAGDLFLFPTSYEAFSLASIEAAASGLPVLMTDVSGAAELIADNSAGSIVHRNPGNIACHVLKYLNDPRLVRETGLSARKRVEQHFSWDRVAEATIHVYRQLIGGECGIENVLKSK